MAKKIELLHTTYDESGNIESQEVVHPLTSPDCIIMENGKTLDEVMGDGIATPTLTHEGTSFKVGVGDSNIEVVDGDVAGMTLKGQSYQNILPKPTTLIMETDEKEFKINDKIDSNIIIDDNIAEIATVKGKTIVNTVQEESGSEYTVLGEDLSGQSITHVKNVPTLEGQTLVNIPTKSDSFTTNKEAGSWVTSFQNTKNMVKNNTKYLIGIFNYSNETKQYMLRPDPFKEVQSVIIDPQSYGYMISTTVENVTSVGLVLNAKNHTEENNIKVLFIEYQEGMENWDIPYFEGEKYFENNIKGVTLQGQTLVNTIQEPCKDDYVVLGAEDGIEISAETGGCGTIENTVQGGINGAVLEGQTLVNVINRLWFPDSANHYFYVNLKQYEIGKDYLFMIFNAPEEITEVYFGNGQSTIVWKGYINDFVRNGSTISLKVTCPSNYDGSEILPHFKYGSSEPSLDVLKQIKVMLIPYQEGMENWDIPYFEGMQSVQMPVVKTTGKNLYNINEDTTHCWQGTTQFVDGRIKVTSTHNDGVTYHQTYNIPVKKGRTYHASVNSEGDGAWWILWKNGDTSKGLDNPFTVDDTFDSVAIGLYCAIGEGNVCYFKPQIEEGSTATEYEPYQSSTVTTSKIQLTEAMLEQGTFSESKPAGTTYEETLPTTYIDVRLRSKSLFKISGNVIRGTLNAGYGIFFGFFKDGKYLAKYSGWIDSTNFSVDVPYECNEFCIVLRKNISDVINVSEYDLIGLTLEQVVELRAIGNVKDELDLTTGKLTQRIGEVVLDGSDIAYTSNNNYMTEVSTCILTSAFSNCKVYQSIMCKDFPVYAHEDAIWEKVYGIVSGVSFVSTIWGFCIRLPHTLTGVTTVDSEDTVMQKFKAYLQSNPITVQYQLATESVKTIDLQVTDQDGNTIPHIQTQPTVTHITASSDYLIPTVTIDNNLTYDTIIKPSTLYTVRFKHNTVNADNPLTVDLGGTTQTVTSTEFTITTPSELTHNQLVFSGKNNVVSEVQVIEGDVTNIEYPFFEGMNGVNFSNSKFIGRGKNLTNLNIMYDNFTKTVSGENRTVFEDGILHLRWDGNPRNATLVQDIFKPKQQYTFSFWCKAPEGYTWQRHMIKIYYTDGTLSALPAYSTSDTDYTQQIITSEYGKTIERIGVDLNNQLSINQVQLEEGSVATSYEPYRGVEVQQDIDSIPLTSNMFEQNGYSFNSTSLIRGMSLQQIPLFNSDTRIKTKTLIKLKPNSTYTINADMSFSYACFNKDGNYLKAFDFCSTFTTDSETHYITMNLKYTSDTAISPSDLDSMNLILQEVPQEIVLRGMGDVKDELDLTRGEYIQRIGEIVLDGSAYWDVYRKEYHGVGKSTFQVYCTRDIPKTFLNDKIYCDILCQEDLLTNGNANVNKYPCNYIHNYTDGTYTVNRFFVSVNKEMFGCTSNDDYDTCCVRFKAWLQQNPITVQYKLATPIIHKVNLTNTKVIQSYATETHYETITPSDSLIPNITIPSTLNYDVAIKPSTEYTIRANTSDNLTVDLGGATGTLSNGKVTLTTPDTLTHNEVKFSGTGKVKELMVVEGNEIKDNVPFFNGMKNVEMGGIKLVNIARGAVYNENVLTANTNKTQFTYTSNGSNWGVIRFDDSLLKPNSVYTLCMNIVSNNLDTDPSIKVCYGIEASYGYTTFAQNVTGIQKIKITTIGNPADNAFYIGLKPCTSGKQVVIQNPMIIEGDWTHLDEIPFIESEMIIEQPIIRSQGKNLLDLETKYFNPSNVTYTKGGVTYTVIGNTSNYNYGQFAWTTADSWFRKLLGKEVTLSVSSISCTNANSKACIQVRMECTNGSKVFKTISINDSIKYITFTIPSNAIDMALQLMSNNTGSPLDSESTLTVSNIQLVLGNTAASYRAYRHQTLYSNRVIGYEDGCYYAWDTGTKASSNTIASIISDVEGLNVAYVTHASSNFSFYDKDGVYLSGSMFLSTATDFDKFGFIKIPANAKYMKMACGNANSAVAKDYHLKATVTGELPLRSLPNGVCDTLNLVTGEYVQRVGEVVLDGSENWLYGQPDSGWNQNGTATAFYAHGILSDKLRNGISVCDRMVTAQGADITSYITMNIECFGLSHSLDFVAIRKKGVSTSEQLQAWLSQNPITVQYELATPIVRKLGFTTKGNYREQVLDGSETWTMDAIDNNKTVRITKKTVSPLQNPLYNTPLFTDDYHVRAGSDSHNTYEYITCIGNAIYINIYQPKVKELSVQGCTQWLSQNPIKVGYITSVQSSESYSNIHKPIFFNNVDVQFLPHNLDIQPQLTYQARTRNSYVVDMMKPNTKYTMKCLSYSDSARLWLSNGTANTSIATNKSFSFAQSSLDNANKQLVVVGQWYEPMIIEGDVTGKNLPYFKGILSSYHDVDEIEVYSVNKNLFDMSKVKPQDKGGTYWWNTIVKENEVVSVRMGNINNGQFGAYAKLNVRPNSTYTLYIEMEKDGEPYGGQIYGYENDDLWGNGTFTGYANTSYHIKTSHNAKYITIGLNYGKDFPIGTTLVSKNMRLYLGEESPVYIPHAHNTTLIEMPTRLETVKVVRPVMEKGCIINDDGTAADSPTEIRLPFIPVQPSEILSFRNGNDYRAMNVHFYDIDKNFIEYIYTNGTGDLVVPNNAYFIRGFARQTSTSDLTIIRQAYKPIQLNSLPNGVCDEIIMKPNSNKAQLVQRVGKVVLDGSEDWEMMKKDEWLSTRFNFYGSFNASNYTTDNIYSNKKYIGGYHGQHKEKMYTIRLSNDAFYIFDGSINEVTTFEQCLQQNPLTVYYELATPVIHEIQLKGYPHVYENGTVTLNTDTPHQTLVSYNVNQEQLINTQNETIIRHDQQIDDLYYYIEMYLEEIYQMELFRMKLELSL